MGHRALVAVEGRDGSHSLYHDQWGTTAFGGRGDPDLATVVARAVGSGRRVGTGLPVRGVLEVLDPREYELLVVCEARGDVSAFLVVWPGLDLASGTAEDGAVALVPVRDATQVRQLRRFLRAAKGHLGDAVDAGTLSGPTAVAVLRAMVVEHPAVPAETVWLPPANDER